MKVPAFKYPGGKARIRDRIVATFPRAGRTYLEPFAGRGNLFFGARAAKLLFSRWWLNDLRTAPFLCALSEVDVRDLPEFVDRAEFERLKATRTSAVARVIEPKVSFLGKTYSDGFREPGAHSGRYARHLYAPRILEAKRLLRYTEVTDLSWEALPWGDLDHRDFVYLDPPYLNCGNVGYGRVDHDALVELLIDAKFRWVISGYDSELYRRKFGRPVSFERAADMARAAGKTETRLECLWSNRWKRSA